MKHSTERILTTHAGSLPRPADLLDLVQTGGAKALDAAGAAARLRAAVSEVVHKQTELGIDVIDDGEYGKPSFVSYINERLGGYEVDTQSGPRNQWMTSREGRSFPEFYAQTHPASTHTHMICTGPITYKGHAQLKRDIDNLKAALNGVNGRRGLHAGDFTVEYRRLAEERVLQIAGGICLRHRRSDA